MANTHDLRVGLFTVATLALAAIVLAAFGGLALRDTSDHYCVVFDGTVMGLDPGADVYLNGVKTGSVDGLSVGADIRKVVVTLKLARGTPVHADTHAVLQLAGITGLKVIDLRDGTSASPALSPGSQIAAGTGMLDKLQAQAEKLADQSSALIDRANRLTDNLIAVTGDLGAIAAPARRAADNTAQLTASLRAMIDENRAALRDSMVEVRRAAGSASQLVDGEVTQLLARAGDVVTELKTLLATSEAPVRAAVFDLRQASRSFKELARDVRQKPSRLLFSSDPAERKLP